jgi:hypothetical protein
MDKHEITSATTTTRDDEKVRLGDAGSPTFGPARSDPRNVRDDGKVRVGDPGSPTFGPPRSDPHNVRDDGKVRLGDVAPSFGTAR